MVVADEFGAGAFGGQVSRMAADLIVDEISTARAGEVHGDGKPEVIDLINGALIAANSEIIQYARGNGHSPGCGAAAAVAIRRSTKLYVKNVGDIQAFILRDCRLNRLTSDQTLAQLLQGVGHSRWRLPAWRSRRSGLLSYLGQHDFVPNGEIRCVNLGHGDRVLLCSNDLDLGDDVATRVLAESASAKVAARKLEQAAVNSHLAAGTSCVVLFANGVV